MYQFFEEDRLERETYEDIQVQGVSVHPRLFWLEDEDLNYFCTFTLFPPEAFEIRHLRLLIEAAGGIVLSTKNPHTIPLVDDYFIECTGTKYSKMPIPKDHFSSKFIDDCIVANKILDLNKYRCTESNYEEFDSNDILLNKLEWTQLSLKKVGQRIPGSSTGTVDIGKTLSPSGASTVKCISGKTALVSATTENESGGGSSSSAINNGGDGMDGAGGIDPHGEKTQRNVPRFTPSKKAKKFTQIMTDAIAMEESDDQSEEDESGKEAPVAPKIRPAWIRRNAVSSPKTVAFSTGDRNGGIATPSQGALLTQLRSADLSTRTPFRQLTERNDDSGHADLISILQDTDESASNRNGGIDQSVPSSTTTNQSSVENEIRGQVTPPLSLENFYPVVAVAVAGPSTRNGIPPTEDLGVNINVSVTNEGEGESFAVTSNPSTRRRGSPVPSTSRRAGGENVTPVSPIHDDDNSDRGSVSSRMSSRIGGRRFFRPYSTEDGRRILDVIIRKEWYDNYMGVAIWKDMEDMELFTIFRPWQGIKEHFVKKILPNLHLPKYRLTPENLLCFQNSKYKRESRRGGRR